MLRVLSPEDDAAERLAHIDNAAFPDRLKVWSADDIRTMLCLWIADEAVEKGYAAIQVAADQAEIVNLAVVPDHRRKGLGAQLLAMAEHIATNRGATKMYLEVAVENGPALALYSAKGYVEEGRRKGYFLRKDGRRIDALIMSKALKPRFSED